jgi:FMN phosphatase YigB (HAD superfamily)
LTEKLERLGLAGYLSTVVSSLDLAAALPDPANYQAALAAMSLAPEQVAFVGHDASELAGARALGMPTIAVNSDAASPADIHLDRFEQLSDCIRNDGAPLVAAG